MLEARRDAAATKARKFLDKRSYVAIGGKVYLFGKDVEPLRRACYERSMGWCEMWRFTGDGSRKCERAISWVRFVMHHEPPYSNGGWDHLDGVQAICQQCDEWRHRGPGRSRMKREPVGASRGQA